MIGDEPTRTVKTRGWQLRSICLWDEVGERMSEKSFLAWSPSLVSWIKWNIVETIRHC